MSVEIKIDGFTKKRFIRSLYDLWVQLTHDTTHSQDSGCFASFVVTQMCNSAFSAHQTGSKNKVIINSFCVSGSVLTRWDFQAFKFSNSFWSPP